METENTSLKDKILKYNIPLNNSQLEKEYNLTELEMRILEVMNKTDYTEDYLVSFIEDILKNGMKMSIIQSEEIIKTLINKRLILME